MKLYAVRMARNKEPVGFFWADNFHMLIDSVDSVTDPDECEYVEISRATAIVWPGKERWKMGEEDGPAKGSADRDDWFDARMSDIKRGMDFDGSIATRGTLSDFVDGRKVEGWRRLDWSHADIQ